MPRFRIGFTEESYGYYYFDAPSIEDAQKLIAQAENFEIDLEDLPAFNRKTNGSQHEWLDALEEVK